MTVKLTIGTDPELLLLDEHGEVIEAGTVLNKTDRFGVDGHRFTAELRPECAVFPRDLVENIRKVLLSKKEQLSKYTWVAGPFIKSKPLGGHIHFGIPLETRFVDALNHQLGIILALSEPQDQAIQRRTKPFNNNNGGKPYGLLGDVRNKPWGFEFRTPGSFISTPGTTLGLITLAKAIVYEEIIKGKSAWSNLPKSKFKDLIFAPQDFHECKKEIFKNKIEDLWALIKNMQYFKEENEGSTLWSAVSYIKNYVIKRNGFVTGRDIKKSWEVIKEETILSNKTPILVKGQKAQIINHESQQELFTDTTFWGLLDS